jgi:hippurate hydrolase
MEVQTIVSRVLDPALPGVITIGAVLAGEASNVIPERSRCTGTIRATTPAVRALLSSELRRVAHAVATVHRLSAEVTLTEGTPPLVNTAKGAAWAQAAARAVLGDDALSSLATANMGGEDFAYYLERTEGCFLRIGTFREGRSRAGVHTPRFDPDEEAIFVGAAVLAECARQATTVASVQAGARRPSDN